MKRKPPSWLDCMVCGKTVKPGSGRVYYPLPIEQRRMLPVRLQAWTQAMKHDDCPLPPTEHEDAPKQDMTAEEYERFTKLDTE